MVVLSFMANDCSSALQRCGHLSDFVQLTCPLVDNRAPKAAWNRVARLLRIACIDIAKTPIMNAPLPHPAVTGAGMDTVVRPRKRRKIVMAILILIALAALAAAAWSMLPSGLQVRAADVRLARAERGVFKDIIIVRAVAEPLNSVLLDSVESGRVEEVLVEDGAMVQKGQLLFRLSNPQRNLDLLARQSEHAQQLSNLSALRVAVEASRSEHTRRVSELRYNLAQSEKQHARNKLLAGKGFVSSAAMEESADRLDQQRRLLVDEEARGASESRVKAAAVEQMETAIRGLDAGLALVHASVAALAVRAPVAGRLAGLQLKVGETVRVDQHLGRIDDPSRFKLVAQVDEFYRSRVARGLRGQAELGGVDVIAAYPQIKDGRFTVDMAFTKDQPAALHPGQGLDVTIALGESTPALLLPNGAWVNDSGGTWVFVVDGAGVAGRRQVRTGRRNASQVEVLSGLVPGEQVIVSSYAAWAKTPTLQLSK
jgi:HlyD family secretion protein